MIQPRCMVCANCRVWTDEAELVAAMKSGRVAIADVPSTFAHGNFMAGKDIVVTDGSTALDQRWWVVPKGKTLTPEAAAFLEYAVTAQVRTALTEDGIDNKVTSTRPAQIDTGGAKTAIVGNSGASEPFTINSAWWVAHGPEVERRWRQ